jgi:hypothetical protein
MIRRNPLKVQLSAVFLCLLSLLVFLALSSVSELGDVNRASADIRDHWLQSTRIFGEMNNFTSDYRAAEAANLLANTPETIARAEKDIVELDRQIALAQDRYRRIPQRPSESAVYERFLSRWHAYHAAGRGTEFAVRLPIQAIQTDARQI